MPTSGFGVLPPVNFLSLDEVLGHELKQQAESGHDVSALEPRVAEALAAAGRRVGPGGDEILAQLLEEVESAPPLAGWSYSEPSGLDEITAVLPPAAEPLAPVKRAELTDRLLGAWQGRCSGCCLGKPVEGALGRAQIRRYLDLAGLAHLEGYFPVLDPMPEGIYFRECWVETTAGRVHGSPRDDDTDYTMLNLYILESHGPGLSTDDVAREWLDHIPLTQTYTAERVAYRNLANGMLPLAAARHHNPYREWIGAQIRADMFGYVYPGRPRAAAELAWREAALSHTANGLYGAMWAAALIAASFCAPSPRDALVESLRHVPARSRLHEAVSDVLDWHAKGWSWDQAMDAIEANLGHYFWVHVLNNSAVIAAALLWGEGNFSRTVGLAVEAGLDTDCTGATAGSVFGALYGNSSVPAPWTAPFGDRIRSSVSGFDNVAISELARRTLALAEKANTHLV